MSVSSGASTSTFPLMLIRVARSSGFSEATNARPAVRAMISGVPCMLKLRSTASATAAGNSPPTNVVIVCGTSSSSTVKSAWDRSRTARPSGPVTVA